MLDLYIHTLSFHSWQSIKKSACNFEKFLSIEMMRSSLLFILFPNRLPSLPPSFPISLSLFHRCAHNPTVFPNFASFVYSRSQILNWFVRRISDNVEMEMIMIMKKNMASFLYQSISKLAVTEPNDQPTMSSKSISIALHALVINDYYELLCLLTYIDYIQSILP